MPVPARAGQPRHLQAQHQPHMPHGELGDQPREPRAARPHPPPTAPDPHRSPSPGTQASPARPPVRPARTAAGSTRRGPGPAAATTAGRRRPPGGHGASPGFCHRRAHAEASCSPPVPSAAGMGKTASRSRSMLSNPRTSFRVASGNDIHSSVSGTFVSAVIRGRCPRRLPSLRIACPQPPGPLHQPKQALPTYNRRANTRLSNAACTMANRLSRSGRT